MPVGALVTMPLPVPALVTVSAKDGKANVAVTLCAALIVTLQVPVPVQPPLQPANSEPAAGAAVNVTAAPLAEAAAPGAPPDMPPGARVTVPAPVPALLPVRWNVGRAKVAVPVCAALIVTVQLFTVPVQLPVQPVNVEPAAGVAVNVTAVPVVKE